MKLYAFQPNEHGQASFFTIAESEEEAKAAVDKYIEDNYKNDDYRVWYWGTDYYTLTVVEKGDVIENDND